MKRACRSSAGWGHLVVVATLLAIPIVRGHTLPVSTLRLVPDAGYLHLGLVLNPSELNFFSELDSNHDGRLDVNEWDGRGEAIARRILGAFELRVDGQPIGANLAGLAQSFESHHIMVRAHFPARARGARVSLESNLPALTSGSHVTEVSFGPVEHTQLARLDAKTHGITFDPLSAAGATRSGLDTGLAGGEVAAASALKANEAAVMVLLGLLVLAGVPPAFFYVLFRRDPAHRHLVPALDPK